ncbi:MAG: TaqI-like C-terminal specificity domain-containing protein [Candidatus Polarisedimenticolia bacterium]
MALQPFRYPETIDPARRRLLGAYYTPAPLVNHLVEATLAPLMPPLERAIRKGRIDDALRIRIVDPACGDGAFLAAACRFVAGRLARAGRIAEPLLRAEVIRRCLHGVDIDPMAVRLTGEALRAEGGQSPLLREADTLSASSPHPDCGFDAIVGNPPWGGWNRLLDDGAKRDYRLRFRVARGLLDPAMLFLERCTLWLRPGGRLGLVMPGYFLMKNYPAARGFVLAEHDLEELARWGMAFDGVNVEACTLVAARRDVRRAAGARRVRCFPQGPAGPVLNVPVSAFRKAPGHVFNLSLDGAGRRLLARLQDLGTPLGDLVEAHEGIHSGNVRARLFVPPRGRPPRGKAARHLAPLLMGRGELRPYVLRPAGWRVVYDPSVVRRHRGEYANLGRAAWYAPPKLMVRRTGDRVVAAVDRAGLKASNNVFVVRRRGGAGASLACLAAWLNSTLATWWFRAVVPRAGDLFAELKLEHLVRLPIVMPARGGREAARLGRLARRLENPRLADHDPARRRVMEEIDDVIGRLAGLSRSEAAIIAACAKRA